MGKIIFNPENGAEIKKIQFEGSSYFNPEKGQATFLPGSVLNIKDDALASWMLEIWGFLRELTPAEAKEFMDNKEVLKCDKCEFQTRFRVALEGHKRKHAAEVKLDDLGIPTLGDPIKEGEEENLEEKREKELEEENKKAGLTGGWSDDRPGR